MWELGQDAGGVSSAAQVVRAAATADMADLPPPRQQLQEQQQQQQQKGGGTMSRAAAMGNVLLGLFVMVTAVVVPFVMRKSMFGAVGGETGEGEKAAQPEERRKKSKKKN